MIFACPLRTRWPAVSSSRGIGNPAQEAKVNGETGVFLQLAAKYDARANQQNDDAVFTSSVRQLILRRAEGPRILSRAVSLEGDILPELGFRSAV